MGGSTISGIRGPYTGHVYESHGDVSLTDLAYMCLCVFANT